jgi:hypothetical protein
MKLKQPTQPTTAILDPATSCGASSGAGSDDDSGAIELLNYQQLVKI